MGVPKAVKGVPKSSQTGVQSNFLNNISYICKRVLFGESSTVTVRIHSTLLPEELNALGIPSRSTDLFNASPALASSHPDIIT